MTDCCYSLANSMTPATTAVKPSYRYLTGTYMRVVSVDIHGFVRLVQYLDRLRRGRYVGSGSRLLASHRA